MSRARRLEDWLHDLAAGRPDEEEVAGALMKSPSVTHVDDRTASMSELDFCFTYAGSRRWIDVKAKLQMYSHGVTRLWEDVDAGDLFIVDETVYRRIVWQGGGGYLVVHDHPGERWVYYGPWELTLGPRRRFARRGHKQTDFVKGKLLLDLSIATSTKDLSIETLLTVIDEAEAGLHQVEPVPFRGDDVPTIG